MELFTIILISCSKQRTGGNQLIVKDENKVIQEQMRLIVIQLSMILNHSKLTTLPMFEKVIYCSFLTVRKV